MNPIPGAQDLVLKLRSMGKKVFFLTNNSTKTREELLEKFNLLGFQASLVIFSAFCIQNKNNLYK
jgi:ribonucleotide monophosphatase NagD (HAD superfamily)